MHGKEIPSDEIGEIVTKAIGSRFLAVNVVVKRARALMDGADPCVANVSIDRPAQTAMREIAAGEVTLKSGRPMLRVEEVDVERVTFANGTLSVEGRITNATYIEP